MKIFDAKILKELYANYSDEELLPVLGFATLEEVQADRAKSDGGFETYDRSILGFIMVVKDSNKAIGRCGFHNWYKAHHKSEIGYAIFNEEVRGHGYMSEAITATIDYGFKQMNLNRIEAFIVEDNEASKRLLVKNGFVQEGRLRQNWFVNGEAQNSLMFSLLKEDFKK